MKVLEMARTAVLAFYGQTGRTPTAEELAARLGKRRSAASNLLVRLKTAGIIEPTYGRHSSSAPRTPAVSLVNRVRQAVVRIELGDSVSSIAADTGLPEDFVGRLGDQLNLAGSEQVLGLPQ